MKKPNILFLMSDEHRADVLGYAGNEVIRTPNLDALARDAVIFNNAYTPSPVCVPGRQALMSGQFPRTNGCERFGQDLSPHYMTFAQRFSQWAYSTVCCGKLHHTGRDQMQGWTQRFAADMYVDESFIQGRNEEAFALYPQRHPRWKWNDLFEIQRARPDVDSRNQRFDARATQAALDFIEEYFVDMTYDRATPDRPLLLKVSLVQPHYPYVTEREKLAYYFNRVQPFVDEPVFDHPVLSQHRVNIGPEGATEREVQRATAAYYGMIENVDAQFGRVVQALQSVGQDLDDWIIVFTSDHGEMLGEHGVWDKNKFFEGSARVPLFIRWPRRFGPRVVEQNVNLCDLFATLCDLAELPIPDGLDSRSLVPLTRGETAEWHSRFHNETVSQHRGKNLMIKRDALKYQYYGEDAPEVLFDLERDPTERLDFLHESEYADALKAFRQRRDELGFKAS